MAAISGQPAPKPQSLDAPVPNTGAQDSLDQFLSNFEAPQMSAPAQAQQTDSLDQFISQFDDATAAENIAEVPDSEIAPEPSFIQANMDQFGQFTTRMQAGLAANDTEKLMFLQKKYGQNNATIKDDKLYWRKSESEKFKRLDPGAFELLNDVLPDWSREIISEIAMVPGEVGGAVAGGPVGAVAGRALSVPVANEIADRVADAAGIPRDETRSKLAENLIGMGAEAILPTVGAKIAGKIANPIMNPIPVTAAYKAAIAAGEQKMVAQRAQSVELVKSMEALNQLGKTAKIDGNVVGVPGATINLMAHHYNEESAYLMAFKNQAASNPIFKNVEIKLATHYGEVVNQTLHEIASLSKPGPYRPEFLGASIKTAVHALSEAEGKAIGSYKAKAVAELKNTRLPLNTSTVNQLEFLLQEMGFTPKLIKQVNKSGSKLAPGPGGMQPAIRDLNSKIVWTPPKDISKLEGRLGLTSTGEVNSLLNVLKEASSVMDRGATIDDLNILRRRMGNLSDRFYNSEAGGLLGKLTGDFRKTYREAIEAGLKDEVDRKAFNQAMDKFSSLQESMGILKMGMRDRTSARAIVRKFFTGPENLAMIREIRKISPESYGNLKSEFVEQLITEYADRSSSTGWKSKQFLDDINTKYGTKFLKEVFAGPTGPSFEGLQHALRVTETIEKQWARVKPDQIGEQQKTGLMNAIVGLVTDTRFKTVGGFQALMRARFPSTHAIYQLMTEEGFEKYVANYPGKIDKKTTLRKLNDFLAETKFWQRVEESVPGESVKRGTKQYLRQGTQKMGSGAESEDEYEE